MRRDSNQQPFDRVSSSLSTRPGFRPISFFLSFGVNSPLTYHPNVRFSTEVSEDSRSLGHDLDVGAVKERLKRRVRLLLVNDRVEREVVEGRQRWQEEVVVI